MGRNKEEFPHFVNGDVKERLWMIELYPDTTDYECDEKLGDLIKFCNDNNYEYAYILHDKDINEITGQPKKPHYHFDIKFENQRFQKALSKLFKIPYNNFKCWDNWEKCVQYLIHQNDNDKYKYSPLEIRTNIPNLDDVLLPKQVSEEKAINMILDYIDSFNNVHCLVDIEDVMRFALKNHIFTHLRRSGSLFACLFDRHRYVTRD